MNGIHPAVGRLTSTIWEVTTRKNIAQDRSYIDYTCRKFDVRVWRDRCQAITCEGTEWRGRDEAKPLPLDPRFRNLPTGTAMEPVHAITFEIGTLGRDELRRITSGELCFEDALASDVAEPAPERIGGDPRLVRADDMLSARDHRRLDSLAPVAGDAFGLEDGQRHTALL
jgi:hypothetical protein